MPFGPVAAVATLAPWDVIHPFGNRVHPPAHRYGPASRGPTGGSRGSTLWPAAGSVFRWLRRRPDQRGRTRVRVPARPAAGRPGTGYRRADRHLGPSCTLRGASGLPPPVTVPVAHDPEGAGLHLAAPGFVADKRGLPHSRRRCGRSVLQKVCMVVHKSNGAAADPAGGEPNRSRTGGGWT